MGSLGRLEAAKLVGVGQLVEVPEAEKLEEERGGLVKERAAGLLAAASDGDDLALLNQGLFQAGGAGLDVVGGDPVMPEQQRQVPDIGIARWLPDRPGTHRARCAFGQGGDLAFGGLMTGQLTHYIGYCHLPAVRPVLLAPIGACGGGVAIHP